MLVSVRQIVISQENDCVNAFDLAVIALGLTSKRFPLKGITGSIHWHIKRPGESGTLEATYDPKGQRLWLEVRTNRAATWQPAVIESLLSQFKPDTES